MVIDLDNIEWNLNESAINQTKSLTISGMTNMNTNISNKTIQLTTYLPVYVKEVEKNTNFVNYTTTFSTVIGNAANVKQTASLPYTTSGYDVYLVWATPVNTKLIGYGNNSDFMLSSAGVDLIQLNQIQIYGNNYILYRSKNTVGNDTIYIRR